MNEYKPLEEYYLHDHGDGNGWQVVTRGPGKWGVTTQGFIEEKDGVISLEMKRYWTGGIGTTETNFFVLSPEEARDIASSLLELAQQGEENAMEEREASATSS